MGRRQSSRELKAELCRRGIRLLSHESLRLATRDFKTLIGEGASGKVYWGVVDDGIPVAVKVITSTEYAFKQGFVETIQVISHIQHKNLNRVVGCCIHKGCRIVVLEYIDNGTLYDLIGDSDRRRSIFSWEKRLSLCIGIARGISYLHHDIHPRVIHRDIKSANIILDANLTPKITDFDFVDFVYKDQDLPLEDRVVGTLGFLDPEYYQTYQYTEKVDVYAFGVLLLEVVSGRRAISIQDSGDDRLILRWVSRLVSNDRKLKVVDPLLTDFPKEEALRFIDMAFLCTQQPSEQRPSMSDVLLMLSGICHPCIRALSGIHLCSIVDEAFIQHYISVLYEGEADCEKNASIDLNSEVIDHGEPNDDSAEKEQIKPCTAEARVGEERTQEQRNGATISQTRLFPENTKRNNNNNVCSEVVYPPFRTMVFTHNTTTNNRNVFPEAVYPPFRTRVFRRLGSRNLYTCEPMANSQDDDISASTSQTAVSNNHSRNFFPEAVYPPFQTGTFRRHGSRNLYTFSTMHSVS